MGTLSSMNELTNDYLFFKEEMSIKTEGIIKGYSHAEVILTYTPKKLGSFQHELIIHFENQMD